MARTLYINGQSHRFGTSDPIGQGGEAIVYRYGNDQVAKIFIEPDDPAYADDPLAQVAARQRIEEHQHKLAAFPTNLTDRVIKPIDLVYSRDNRRQFRVAGYTMQFLSGLEVLLMYANKKYRRKGGIDANQAVSIFRDLRQVVHDVHRAGVVIGDFNDLNVLVGTDNKTYLVDADSMQYGRYHCRTFTNRFLDPLICEPTRLKMVRPHTQSSDWYAFATMLFQSLLFINPYGGTHDPKDGSQPLTDTQRFLQRVTVFAPNVIYPKVAVPISALPDDLLAYFTELFTKDKRDVPSPALLDNLRWTTCATCNLMHARRVCPACVGVGAPKEVLTIRGSVKATRLFRTTGQLIQVAWQDKLRYVYHERDAYRREDGSQLTAGALDRDLRVRVWGNKTVLAKGETIAVLEPNRQPELHTTQRVGRLPVFATNSRHLYWIAGSQLVRDTPLGTADIGSILPNRTLVWVGEDFGFGFFRAGALTRGLVFDATRSGINDRVPLPPMTGNLIDATCIFAKQLAWFMVCIEQNGEIRNHCYVISDRAELLAHAEAPQGDGSWLGDGIRGRMAQGQWLFAATDTGIVRIERDGDELVRGRDYPDTEPFVDTSTKLLPSKEGIVAVSSQDIVLLQIR